MGRAPSKQSGQGVIEYSIILALIVCLALAMLGWLGKTTNAALCGVSNGLGKGGAIAGWGDDSYGQLADGNTSATQHLTAIRVAPAYCNFIQVASGNSHSEALANDGTVWTWGANDFGQLGRTTTLTCSALACDPNPGQVSSGACTVCSGGLLNGIIYVGAGSGFSFAVRSDGTVWAWGAGTVGQLGQGAFANSATPVEVLAGGSAVTKTCDGSVSLCLAGITQISGGAAFGVALRNDGTVWTWGQGTSGQLGNALFVNKNIPQAAPMPNGTAATSVTPDGGFHASALLADGTVAAWGDDTTGETGQGVLGTNIATAAIVLKGACAACSGAYLGGITQISNGHDNIYALSGDGTLYAWGTGMGNGIGVGGSKSLPVVVLGLPAGIVSICGRGAHAAVLTSTGYVYGWGQNDYGQVGNGNVVNPQFSTLQVPSWPNNKQPLLVSCGVTWTYVISLIPLPQ